MSGRSAAWLARHVRDVEALGSNPSAPTIKSLISRLMTVKPFAKKPQRIHLLYSGKVQGVGFRFTFENIAKGLGIKGYVSNLAEGTVEAICEGPKDSLDSVVDKVAASMGGYIRSCKIITQEATGEFSDFRILF